MLYGGATLWRNITMKRKPKMHNEQEFKRVCQNANIILMILQVETIQ